MIWIWWHVFLSLRVQCSMVVPATKLISSCPRALLKSPPLPFYLLPRFPLLPSSLPRRNTIDLAASIDVGLLCNWNGNQDFEIPIDSSWGILLGWPCSGKFSLYWKIVNFSRIRIANLNTVVFWSSPQRHCPAMLWSEWLNGSRDSARATLHNESPLWFHSWLGPPST